VSALPVSVLLLTLDEEGSLPRCLQALAWCDDIHVLDSGSTDHTREIAQSHGARVTVRPFDSFAGQRNYGLDTLDFAHPWVLHLDADEEVTPELVQAIAEAVGRADLDAYRIPSKTMFEGKWLRRSGMYPTYQVRLTRRGAFRFRQVGHGQKEDVAAERIGIIDAPYVHYPFAKGLHDWFDKHNRYSTQEALAEAAALRAPFAARELLSPRSHVRRQALRRLAARLPARSFMRFSYMYFLRGGFLDGRAGLRYSMLLAVYELMIQVKRADLERTRT